MTAKYRNHPELFSNKLCLTDGGLETVLTFELGIELPAFASFTFFEREDSRRIFFHYLQPYIDLAIQKEMAFQLVDCGWRASRDWGVKLGFSQRELENCIRRSNEMLLQIRKENETPESPMPIVGCIGPRGDGYATGQPMQADEAMTYHHDQIKILSDTATDYITAMTLNYTEEAIGIIKAAKANQMPVTLSFTVETDGNLPSGMSLREAIQLCDNETDSYATGYMINCAHPSHFDTAINSDSRWKNRIRGIRANASRGSHEELDNSTVLDRGNPKQLGREMAGLFRSLPNLRTVGGCCGTDIAHITAIAEQCSELKQDFQDSV